MAKTAMEFWKSAGIEETRRVCEAAGTSYENFKHIAHQRRRPSVKLAKALQQASGGQLSAEQLIFAEIRP